MVRSLCRTPAEIERRTARRLMRDILRDETDEGLVQQVARFREETGRPLVPGSPEQAEVRVYVWRMLGMWRAEIQRRQRAASRRNRRTRR